MGSNSLNLCDLQDPFVIRNGISDWKIQKYSISNWCDVFGDKVLTFRKGDGKYRKNPYWEHLCNTEKMTIDEFFKLCESNTSSDWLYYDYKYMKDVFPVDDKILQEIKWSTLGFKHLSGKDSTIWIGSKGAHTPCHIDTYGCNLVAQLYGSKLWLLIPPDEIDSMKPVRVPYEESSIYSGHNFYTPSESLLSIRNVHKVVLSQGDVLYVPRHWWHYVENLETSISVNTWMPLEIDNESRLEEALVRNYVNNICQELELEEAKLFLNPNEHDLLTECFNCEMLNSTIEKCLEYRKTHNDHKQEINMQLSDHIFKTEKLENHMWKQYVEEKQKTHGAENSQDDYSNSLSKKGKMIQYLINSYCNVENVKKVKEILLKEVGEN